MRVNAGTCRWAAALLAICLAASVACGDELLLGRVSHVTDGDTLTLMVDGSRHRVRLFQIDAPEHDQPGSAEARAALSDKVADRYVRVQVSTVDDYGRAVGTVFLGDRDVNRELVREGHAWAYRHYLEDRSLLDEEAAARRAQRGLWSQADPTPPWEWRHANDSTTAARNSSAGSCLIKGNISRGGERIYHMPGDRYYEQTRISTRNGERMFCSPAEAEQAGWRRAR